jgi:acetolactate decarboxylase
MGKKYIFNQLLLVTIFLVFVISGCATHLQNRDILYQTSTINALLEGVYDGNLDYKSLKQHGNFGIGTFEELDGEMIGFDGKFYQIKADGTAYPASDSKKTPFAVVTFFESDKSVPLDKVDDYKQLGQLLDSNFPTKNIFYAIRIDGNFKYIKTRSVPKQNKPYIRLVDVVKNQPTFEFRNVDGTIVGYWCPSYAEGVNVPGYHFHFLTKDKKSGGHLLECQMENVKAEIDYTSNFYMELPNNTDFYKVDLEKNKKSELGKVEK